MAVEPLQKAANAWCTHCDIGQGCRIYADRPQQCRDFNCQYLVEPAIGEHWRPTKSRMVIRTPPDGKGVAVHVDPTRPNAWRAETYYKDIKGWSKIAAERGQQFLVIVGERTFAILPDSDTDLGNIAEGDLVWTGKEWSDGVLRQVVKVIKPDEQKQHPASALNVFRR